jgi:hypothetical protein
VFVTAGPSTKLFAWGGGEIGGHVLRETTSRGLCGLVCPSRTSERGGEGDCVKEGVDIQPTTRHSWRGRTGRERNNVEADVDDGRGRIRAGQAGGGGRAAAPAACAPAAGVSVRGCVCVRANTRGAREPRAHRTLRSCPLCAHDLAQLPCGVSVQ